MFTAAVFFGLGLVVGWNFLPQPEFVRARVEQVTDAIRDKLNI